MGFAKEQSDRGWTYINEVWLDGAGVLLNDDNDRPAVQKLEKVYYECIKAGMQIKIWVEDRKDPKASNPKDPFAINYGIYKVKSDLDPASGYLGGRVR